ncbi:MAG: DUF1573 domain-containing protein [Planctomycetes bacterium]|nr:DUF1573 domain-containing protein [Planctomycetota bacterium]
MNQSLPTTPWVVLMLPLLSCVALAQQPQAPPATSQPRVVGRPMIELSATEWDFGEAWYGDRPAFDLKITNKGTADLEIDKVHVSCACTAAKPEDKVLPPGESTEMKVEFLTRKKQGDVRSSVVILSNDPEHQRSVFKIKGHVKRIFTIEPARLSMSGIDPAGPYEAVVRIENLYPEPARFEVISGDDDQFAVKVKEITPGKVFELSTKTKAPLRRGFTNGQVVLDTGLKRQPRIEVPMFVTIKPSVEPVPSVLISSMGMRKPHQKTVKVKYYGDDENFKVTRIVCPAENIKVELGERRLVDQADRVGVAPKMVYHIVFSLPPGPELPRDGVEVEIWTNDPECEKLIVTVARTYPRKAPTISYKRGKVTPETDSDQSEQSESSANNEKEPETP